MFKSYYFLDVGFEVVEFEAREDGMSTDCLVVKSKWTSRQVQIRNINEWHIWALCCLKGLEKKG